MLKCATIQCNVKTKMNIQRRTALKTFCVGITDGEVTLQGLFIIDIIDLSLSKQGQSFWAPLKVRLRKTDFWHNIKYLDLKGIQCKELWWWWWSGCCVMTSGPAPDWQKLEKETADKGWDAALHLSTSSSATSQSNKNLPENGRPVGVSNDVACNICIMLFDCSYLKTWMFRDLTEDRSKETTVQFCLSLIIDRF